MNFFSPWLLYIIRTRSITYVNISILHNTWLGSIVLQLLRHTTIHRLVDGLCAYSL